MLVRSRLREERQRRAHVVVLRLELGEPRRLALPAQLRLGPLGQCHAPRGVTSPRGVRTELLQAVGRVLPHHLEQVVPCLAGRAADEQERRVRQALDPIQRAALVTGEADLGDGRQRRATPEHGEPGQQPALLFRRAGRSSSRGSRRASAAGPAGREGPPARKLSRSVSRSRTACGRRARTRAAASSTASGSPSTRRQSSRTVASSSSVTVKSGCSARARCSKRACAAPISSGANGKDVLAGEMQDGAARDEDRQARRPREEPDEGGRRLLHVLGVVEQEQELLGAERLGERLERLRDVGDADRLRDGRHDELGVAQRGELDEHDTVRVGRGCAAGGFERQPGLAASACAGEHEQPCVSALEQSAPGPRARARVRSAGSAAGTAPPWESVPAPTSREGSCWRIRRCSSRRSAPGRSPSSSSSRRRRAANCSSASDWRPER